MRTSRFTNPYRCNANGEHTGRTLSGVAYTLAYDYDGQLTSITQGSNTTGFAYDVLGRRITRTAGGVTTQFLTDPLFGHVWLEAQGSTTTAAYTYGNALIRKDGEIPLFDGLGSERTVTNASQTVTGTITFEGFGQTIATTGSSTNPYMFAATSGYCTDADAGLMHVGARYYDAQVGRFVTRDTVLTEHPYLYCDHDPVNAVDPTGHFPLLLAIAIGVGIGLVIEAGKDYLDDGRFNDPWWHYAGWGTAGGIGGAAVAIFRGIATIGGVAIKGALHGPHHLFPRLSARLPHIQINWWRLGVKGSGGVWRLPLPKWWPWK